MPSRGWFIIQFICTVFEQALKTLFLTQLEQAEEAGNITPLGISRRSLTCNNTQFSELLMACDKKKTDLPVATPVKFKPTEVILGVEFNLGSWGLSTNTQQFHSNRLSNQKSASCYPRQDAVKQMTTGSLPKCLTFRRREILFLLSVAI